MWIIVGHEFNRESDMMSGSLGRELRSVAFSAVALTIFAGSALAQQTPPRSGDAVWTYLNGVPKAERLAVIEREARREGGFVMYGATGIDRAEEFLSQFRAKYPGIKAEFVRMQDAELIEKMGIEQRTGRVNGDVAISTTSWLEQLKDFSAPYEPTTWEDFDERFRFGGKDQKWTTFSFELLPTTIVWRSDRISKDEAPKTLEDVANLKWKGRTGATTLLERFIDAMQISYGVPKANEMIKILGQLDNHLYPSTAALSDAIAAGQVDLAWTFSNPDRPIALKKQGAPIDFVYQDPLFGSGGTISIVKGTARPYSAALIYEFYGEPKTLEGVDKGVNFYGQKKGKFGQDLSKIKNMTVYGPMSEARFNELHKVAEDVFIRGAK
jgi:iron(III) transport system substrate-binding protein